VPPFALAVVLWLCVSIADKSDTVCAAACGVCCVGLDWILYVGFFGVQWITAMRVILVGLMEFAILDARRCLDVYVSSVLPDVYSSFVQMNKHSVHTHTLSLCLFLSLCVCVCGLTAPRSAVDVHPSDFLRTQCDVPQKSHAVQGYMYLQY
jgi:hypothetical protein